MINMHAERCADPRQLRWVFGGTQLPCAGVVTSAPGPLGEHHDIESIAATPNTITVTMRNAPDWRICGPALEAELLTSLERSQDWLIDRVDVVRRAATEILDGWFGEYVASHGGNIELIDTHGNIVDVALHGACHGCPASTFSLQLRFRRALETLVGGPVVVRAVN